jgi:hypothetical protein
VCLLTTSLAASHSDRPYRIRRNVSFPNLGISYCGRVSLSLQRACGESSPCRQVCGHILTTVLEFRTILIYFRGHGNCVLPWSPAARTPSRSRTSTGAALESLSRNIAHAPTSVTRALSSIMTTLPTEQKKRFLLYPSYRIFRRTASLGLRQHCALRS